MTTNNHEGRAIISSRTRPSAGPGTWIRNIDTTSKDAYRCETCGEFVQRFSGVQLDGHPMVYVHIVDPNNLCGPVLDLKEAPPTPAQEQPR